jgi:acyl-coenzyme A thioesterase PaaI-like protein
MNERASLNLPNQIQKMLSGSIPPPPIANLIGFKVTSIESGKAVIEFEAGEKHANPMGTLHGEFCVTLVTQQWVWPTQVC